MAPLEYLCPGLPGNVLSPIRASAGCCIGPRCFPDCRSIPISTALAKTSGRRMVSRVSHLSLPSKYLERVFLPASGSSSQVGRPGGNQNARRKKAHRAWRECRYSRFLWSVHTWKGTCAPSSHCLHSSMASSSSLFPMS